MATISVDPHATGAAGVPDTRFFGHPRGLSTLFFTELWERFSYYGMRALLILFMTAPLGAGGLGFEIAKAGVIYGTYTALVYFTALPGGWLADRFFGQRRATLYGGVLIMFGHICLAIPALATFYLGLALIVSGTGLLKPNISVMVGQLYGAEDTRRDAGFSIFYMGINLGAFLAPLVCGWLAQSEQFGGILGSAGIAPESAWHWGFAMAAIGMFFGLVQYLAGWKHLGAAGLHPGGAGDAVQRERNRRTLRRWSAALVAGIGLIAALGATGALRVTPEGIGSGFGIALLVVTAVFFGRLFSSGDWTPAERNRLITIGVLFVASTVFWAVYEQAGSTLNLFAERDTENRVLGMAFPASWYQSLPPVYVVLLAPLFAWLWMRLGRRDPSSPAKFVLGLVLVGLGFVILVPAAGLASSGVKVTPLWLALTYLLHTIGELCLSPVGLSATTKLAPARVVGLMMGVWFLSLAAGNYLGGRVAALYEALPLPVLFGVVGGFAIAAGLVLALFVRPIGRMLARAR
ncbi:MAG TPA: peptide MFS transporter [Gemmatimonadales bacterium]|nr:peptide MFS transporter [Gemmatimonadales bacterium]